MAAVEGPIFVTDTASLTEAVSKARAGGEIVVKAGDYVLAAPLNTLEQGKPLKESLVEVDYAAGFFRFFAHRADRPIGLRSLLPE